MQQQVWCSNILGNYCSFLHPWDILTADSGRWILLKSLCNLLSSYPQSCNDNVQRNYTLNLVCMEPSLQITSIVWKVRVCCTSDHTHHYSWVWSGVVCWTYDHTNLWCSIAQSCMVKCRTSQDADKASSNHYLTCKWGVVLYHIVHDNTGINPFCGKMSNILILTIFLHVFTRALVIYDIDTNRARLGAGPIYWLVLAYCSYCISVSVYMSVSK